MPIQFKQFKFKIQRDVAECIKKAIESVIEKQEIEDDNDRLLLAVLASISQLLNEKLAKGINELKVSLKPDQAIALRIFYFDFINDFTTYEGNKLFALANKIAKEMNI